MVLAAVLAGLVLASPASAAPIPIRHDRDAQAIALAGPDVLVMSERGDDGMKLVAVPRTGGQARTLLAVLNAGLTLRPSNLTASAQRVGVIVEVDGTKRRPDEHRVYSGPPSGPLQIVRRTPDPDGEALTPFIVSADGDRLLLVEGVPQHSEDDESEDYDDPGELRVQILDSAGWSAVAWASATRLPVAIAGPYAAVQAERPRRVELVDLATGRPLATVAEGLTLDLDANGRMAVRTKRGIEIVSATEPQRAIANSGRLVRPQFAGGALAAINGERSTLSVVGVDGSQTTLGPPSTIRTDMEADEQGVAWLFNGCIRYAAFADTAVTGTNPCPTSELALYTIGPSSRLRGNTATVPARCVTSVSGRCRGTLVAKLDYETPIVGRGTFDLPANNKWIDVTIRFNRRTVEKFIREDFGSLIVNAQMRNGTVGTGGDDSAEFSVEIDDRS